MRISLLRISLLRFFKKFHKFALCVVLMQIFGYFISLVRYFWLMRIWLMRIFSRTKSRIRQEPSVFCATILLFAGSPVARPSDKASKKVCQASDSNDFILTKLERHIIIAFEVDCFLNYKSRIDRLKRFKCVQSIFNIIRWVAGSMGQTTQQPSVWRCKYYLF